MKRKIYSIITILFATVMLFLFASCSMSKDALGGNNQAPQNNPNYVAGTYPENAPSDDAKEEPENGETNNHFTENPFVSTEKNLFHSNLLLIDIYILSFTGIDYNIWFYTITGYKVESAPRKGYNLYYNRSFPLKIQQVLIYN